MQQSGIGSNEYDRPRNAELLIMTDNLSDNESDSDMLTSTTKKSGQEPGLHITTDHLKREYQPKSPSLHSFMSISNSTVVSHRTSRNASRSNSPFCRNRRDSIASLRSLTELNLHGDSNDSFLPALDGLLSWDNCHSTSLTVVSSDLIDENSHSTATPTNLSVCPSPTGFSHNQRQSMMNSNFSAAAGSASVMATRPQAEPLKHPSPFPPPSHLNSLSYIVMHSTGTTPSTISSQGQTPSRPQSPVSGSRTSFDSVGGNWLVRPPDETCSDGDTDRGSHSACASPPKLHLQPSEPEERCSRRGRMKKIYCKDPSLDKKEYSLTPAIAALSSTTYSDDNALKELVQANNVNAALTEANRALKQEIALLKQKLDAINETVDNDLLRAIVKGSLPPSTIVKPNCMSLTYL